MDYLTEEEEYELRYGDDLDALNEMETMECDLIIESQNLKKHAEKFPVREDEIAEVVLHRNCNESDYFSPKKLPKRPLSSEEESFLPDSSVPECKRSKLTEDESDEPAPKSKYGNADHIKTVNLTPRPSQFNRLPLTKSDGTKAYFRVFDEGQNETDRFSFSRNVSSLLNAPIFMLKSEATALLEKIRDSATSNILPSQTENEDVCRKEDELWVEKYRPHTYMDLLSDEGVNRTLLQWLKLWDKTVFGKENKKPKPKKMPTNAPQQQQQSKFRKFLELNEEPDEHGRPQHKVAFLCGPPGLGKTTLANIIASHAGYNVVELNASDDRSPDVFRVSLEAATQMKAVLDQDKRPNCLVIDEIDGAPAPSINVLLSFIKSNGVVKGKRKKGDVPILMRPVICICNDQYTPALKPLRQLALVLNFPPTSTGRLSSRLHEVVIKQCLKADSNAITLLCEKTDNDIRSCLSTLQFIFNQKKELLVSDVKGMEIGMKDVQKTLFAVWLEVFFISRKKTKTAKMLSNLDDDEISKSNDSSLKFRFNKVLHSIQTCSEYEKLLSGLFENYLNIKYKDTHLEAIWKGPEWLCFADIIQEEISHSQLYALMPYLPYSAAAFHLLYGCSTYPQIFYPFSAYECNTKRTQFLNILTSVVGDIVASVKNFLNVTSLVLDLLPALVEVIKPTLRPVSIQLYSDREKAELAQIIKVMIAFNLNYRQERSVEGQYSYVLEPNVEELVHFSGLKPKRVLTYATKQLISREVELEKMRRHEGSAEGLIVRPAGLKNPKNHSTLDVSNKAKKILIEKPNLDFFGRKIEEKIDDSSSNTKPDENARKDDIWFHFKEGYSNAVRRTVWIQDLL